IEGAEGAGFPPFDCADAKRHSGGDPGDWQGGRSECGPAGGGDSGDEASGDSRGGAEVPRGANSEGARESKSGGRRSAAPPRAARGCPSEERKANSAVSHHSRNGEIQIEQTETSRLSGSDGK